jgi:hypothetical protein
MVETTGLPLVAAPPFSPDVMGQPHIWIMEYDICKQAIYLMQNLAQQNNTMVQHG